MHEMSFAEGIRDTVLRLLTGEIVAIKRVGGFHRACDAGNPEAVERLRERKGRGAGGPAGAPARR